LVTGWTAENTGLETAAATEEFDLFAEGNMFFVHCLYAYSGIGNLHSG
jgi:hypothetical protein